MKTIKVDGCEDIATTNEIKEESSLDSFVVPKCLYDTAYNGKRNDNGVLILPKEFDENE